MKISLVISTHNRHFLMESCLRNVFKNTFKQQDYEVILIDQSDNRETEKIVKQIGAPVRYFRQATTGLAKARNLGIQKSRGEIICFTDDDCLVGKNWLSTISKSLISHPEVIGLFGKVLPYQPKKNQGKICPCIFKKRKEEIIIKPCFHSNNIGFGNNMAFKRKIFKKMGGFKEWLGPGSIAKNGEDAEFALRLLINGYELLYNPKVRVYHNRWLTEKENAEQGLSYVCGEIACYGYLALKGLPLGKDILKRNVFDSVFKVKEMIKNILLQRKENLDIRIVILEVVTRVRGLAVACAFSLFN